MKFKSEVVFFDEQNLKRLKVNAEAEKKRVNEILNKVDEFLKNRSNKVVFEGILEEGYDFLLEQLRKDFPFPNATDDFNFNAMGIDPKPMKREIDKIGSSLSLHGLGLIENRVDFTEEGLEKLKNASTYRTKTEEGAKRLKFAKKLCDFLNSNHDDLLSYCKINSERYGVNSAVKIFGDYVMRSGDSSKPNFVPNYFKVSV